MANEYTTSSPVLRALGIQNPSTEQTLLVNESIEGASRFVDNDTNEIWNTRSLTVLTEAVEHQRKLFMPFKIQSITTVKEGVRGGQPGVLLSVDDFHVYRSYLEKDAGVFWSREQLDIEVVGIFGPVTTDADIVRATVEIASQMAQLKKRSFVNQDGIEQTVLQTALPDFVKDILNQRRKYPLMDQVFKIS